MLFSSLCFPPANQSAHHHHPCAHAPVRPFPLPCNYYSIAHNGLLFYTATAVSSVVFGVHHIHHVHHAHHRLSVPQSLVWCGIIAFCTAITRAPSPVLHNHTMCIVHGTLFLLGCSSQKINREGVGCYQPCGMQS